MHEPCCVLTLFGVLRLSIEETDVHFSSISLILLHISVGALTLGLFFKKKKSFLDTHTLTSKKKMNKSSREKKTFSNALFKSHLSEQNC